MANRLDPINMVDFTGGLNTRASPFQLGENETPESLNVAVDRLGGIYSRFGWERWSTEDLWDDPETWDPRRAFMHALSDGTFNRSVRPWPAATSMSSAVSIGVSWGRIWATISRCQNARPSRPWK